MTMFENTTFAAVACLSATILYLTLLTVYRLTLPPLASFPGPLLARATDWHLFVPVSKGDQHLHLQRLHEEYGDVVGIAPNKLSFRTIQALQDIYGDRKANQVKTGFTEVLVGLQGSRDLQTHVDRHVHAATKRKVGAAFSDEALRSAEDFILKHVRTWCSSLGSSNVEWSPMRNMKDWTQYLMVDILGDLAFGQSFDAIQSEKTILPAVVDDSVKLITMIATIPKSMQKLVIHLLNAMQAIGAFMGASSTPITEYQALIEKRVKERLELQKADNKPEHSESKHHDFFHYLLEAKDPETGQALSTIELVNNASLLVGAGYDTSAATMDTCLWYLTHNPEVLHKVQTKLRQTFTNVEEIRASSMLSSSQAYLRACIDESLRMSSPVLGVLDRIVLKGGMIIDGHIVPTGTTVSVPIYAIHHNESYYPDAWSFKPERWIGTEEHDVSNHEQVALARKALFAFSAGPRVCIGKNLAYMDMMIALGRLLYTFDIELAADMRDGAGDPSLPAASGRHRIQEYQLEDWFLNRRVGTKVKFRVAVQEKRDCNQVGAE